jgi:catechol 2,3-dioxygenase-like lactoylglutathione lyase family enzyme
MSILEKSNKKENLKIGSIVIHCFEFEKMIEFWSKALNYQNQDRDSDDWIILKDPNNESVNLSFQKREKKRDRRNWIHLDLYTHDQVNEVERLKKLGAKNYHWRYEENADYVVLEDPDGNLFCVVQI